jgi:hypothetical protein
MGLEGVVAKRVDSRSQPGCVPGAGPRRSIPSVATLHYWVVPPEEWRGDRGCVVLGLRTNGMIAMAGVVESGYGRDLVEQLPQLTREELRLLQTPGSYWHDASKTLTGKANLEWRPAGGLRHASIVEVHGPI